MSRERARGLAPTTAIAASLALGLTATGCAAAASATTSSHTALTSAASSAPPQPSAPASAPSTVSASATSSASSAASPQYVLYNCSFQGVVEPPTDTLACADGNALLQGLHWATWTPQLASAYGTFVENDCQPSCVGGHFHSYPVVVTAWGSGSVQGHPAERRYTELTLMFPGARPPYYNGSSRPTHPLTQTFPA
jgi:hypothetical protein